MYKTLNKKSLIYKSNINNLHTKIQNIGDKATLDQRLSSLQSRERDLNGRIMNLNNQIVAIQTKNSIDESEAAEISKLNDSISDYKSKLSTLDASISQYTARTKVKKEDIANKYNSDKELLNTYTAKHQELSKIWIDKSNRLSTISENITSIEAELANTNTDSDIADRYLSSCNTLKEYTNELKALDIPVDTELILPLTNYITFAEKFITQLDKFKDNLTPSDIEFIVHEHGETYDNELKSKQQSIMNEIEKAKIELATVQANISILATLENRPTNCKIDTCPFISEALQLKKGLDKDPVDELSALQEHILSLSGELSEIQKKIEYSASMYPKSMELGLIIQGVLENSEILDLLYPFFVSSVVDKIANGYSFNEIRDHSRETDGLNLLKLYQDELQSSKMLEVEYNGYREKIQLLNSSKALLEKLKTEQSDLVIEIRDTKTQLDEYKKTMDNISNNIGVLSKYNAIVEQYRDIEAQYNIAYEKYQEYQTKSAKALEALSNINSYRSEIEKLSMELQPVMKDISTISGQLVLLDSYYIEYNEYKSSYDMIETLKKYCNPTGGGIQTLFMQIYMSKTRDTANEVLAMLFNGGYKLLDFVINENEFRIPFIGEGLPVDDISSGSNAQISMMSMIINLVLLHQASTKFNIAQLDEIGQGLDNYNSSQFINVLFHCMKILNIEQLFLISHSTESDNTYADIIKLKGYDDYESSIKSGNVIWDFDEICKKGY